MHPSDRIATRMPLTELWDDEGPREAERVRALSESDFLVALRQAPRPGEVCCIVADLGSHLQWLTPPEVLAFWKSQARGRIVEPGSAFRLEDFQGDFCFLVSEWKERSSAVPIYLFEKQHQKPAGLVRISVVKRRGQAHVCQYDRKQGTFNMQVEHRGTDRLGRATYLGFADALEELATLSVPSAPYALFMGADMTRSLSEPFYTTAERLLGLGAVYVLCWGPGCQVAEDIFDEAVVGDGIRDPLGDVMTTSHPSESLCEALAFATSQAVPGADAAVHCEVLLIVLVGNVRW